MNLDIENYLSEEQLASIAAAVFREELRTFLTKQYVCSSGTQTNLERVLYNAMSDAATSVVDEHFGEDLPKMIEQKAIEAIEDISSYNVFKKPDAWDREASKGWEYLQKAMTDNKHLVEERVKTLFEGVDIDNVTDYTMEVAAEVIERKLFGGKQNV